MRKKGLLTTEEYKQIIENILKEEEYKCNKRL